jgi:proteic killer suppression protein
MRVLAVLHAATGADEMKLPGFGLHALHGDRAGRFAVSISGNWRVTFEFSGTDAILVDYEDYH